MSDWSDAQVPRMEVEHRACLVPWPDRDGPDISITAALLEAEAAAFGLEVINIWYIRGLLKAIAKRLARDEEHAEQIVAVGCCQDCGTLIEHVRGCSQIKP